MKITHGYRQWDSENHEIVICRNIRFDESIKPPGHEIVYVAVAQLLNRKKLNKRTEIGKSKIKKILTKSDKIKLNQLITSIIQMKT